MKTATVSLYNRAKRKERICGLLFASPPIVGFLLFAVVPLIFSLYMSVCRTSGSLIENMKFLGGAHLFDNFKAVLTDPLFGKSIINTLYAMVQLPVSIGLSLLLSVLITQKGIRLKKFFRTLFFLPFVCSIVAITTMWRTMLDKNYGIVNMFLGLFGVSPVAWLTNEHAFMPAMILMGVWMNIGFNVILFSAALTSVNESLYEAASLDGATKRTQFFKITLPVISGTTFYVLVTGIIGGLQEFTRFQAINGASNLLSPTGPKNAGLTVVFYLYNKGFTDSTGMGQAAAVSWILFLLIGVVTLINFKLSDKWVQND